MMLLKISGDLTPVSGDMTINHLYKHVKDLEQLSPQLQANQLEHIDIVDFPCHPPRLQNTCTLVHFH